MGSPFISANSTAHGECPVSRLLVNYRPFANGLRQNKARASSGVIPQIIVPVLDGAGENVVGTIDVESEKPNAFPAEVQTLLEACSKVIRPLWLR